MWLFLSDSMMMPSLAPMDKADPQLTLGRRTLQIRGRLRSHLNNFIENYGEGLDFSEIEDNPYADYTCRFYATPEAFGEAMKRAIMDIDYKKFKDTAKRPRKLTGLVPERAQEYAGVLMSVWSITQRVGRAGGFYSPRSASNPNGYDPNRRYSGSVGSSFYGSSKSKPTTSWGTPLFDDEPDWWNDLDEDDLDEDDLDDFDYTPRRERHALDLLADLAEVPTDQWEDELTEDDFTLVKPYMAMARRQEKRLDRMRRNADRKRSGKKGHGRHNART